MPWCFLCLWVIASFALSNAFKYIWGLLFDCFGGFYPSVIVILSRTGGLRQVTPSQQKVTVGLGHILALDVPMR